MQFRLRFSEEAKEKRTALELDKWKKGLLKQLNKVLGFMETNLRTCLKSFSAVKK